MIDNDACRNYFGLSVLMTVIGKVNFISMSERLKFQMKSTTI